MSETVLGIK